MKRNNGNIFGLFVFWKAKANKNNREKARKRNEKMDIQMSDKI